MGDCVAIVGDGQMGLVLAELLASRGVETRLWGRSPDKVAELARTRRSPQRLPGFELPEAVRVTPDPAGLFDGVTVAVNAVPTQYIRSVWTSLGASGLTSPIVCVSKGIENGTLLRPSEVLVEAIPGVGPVCSLSGPTIAAELAEHKPATMVAAAEDEAVARQVQELFTTSWLRVYRHDDLVGVEIAGAAKNVIALAAGMVDGLQAGYNAKSALLARGLAEIARFGAAMGAKVDTFFGVAGVGDLATTCFCPQGRNRSFGERLGRGEPAEQILQTTVSVVEGVPTTRSIAALAERIGVDLPITQAVHEILFGELTPRDAIAGLMQREPKAERVG